MGREGGGVRVLGSLSSSFESSLESVQAQRGVRSEMRLKPQGDINQEAGG